MKTVCPQGRVGSNPTLSAGDSSPTELCDSIIEDDIFDLALFGEVPKLAEGAPLERE